MRRFLLLKSYYLGSSLLYIYFQTDYDFDSTSCNEDGGLGNAKKANHSGWRQERGLRDPPRPPETIPDSAQRRFEEWESCQGGRRMASEIFATDVDALFTLLFKNSKFYLQFHRSRKIFGELATLSTHAFY